MHGLIHEELPYGDTLTVKDLTRHLYARMWYGKIVIIAQQPTGFISILRKHWLKLCRKVQRECSSTLNATRLYEFSQIITQMQDLCFTTKWPSEDYPADVYVISVDQALRWTPECRTMYVTYDIELEQLYKITAWMPPKSVVVAHKMPLVVEV